MINASTTAALTITLDGPQTVGSLVLGNSASATAGYTLSGAGTNTLTLDNSGYPLAGGGAMIAVAGGSQAIDAPLVLADNLSVSGSGTLVFGTASSIVQTGSHSLTMSGTGGTLILSGSDSYTAGTYVDAGTLIAASGAALADGTSLTIGAGGLFLFDPSAATVSLEGSPMVGPSDAAVAGVPEPEALALWVAALCCAAVYCRAGRRHHARHDRRAPPIPDQNPTFSFLPYFFLYSYFSVSLLSRLPVVI